MARKKGSGSVSVRGYIVVQRNHVKKMEHVFVAEAALGYELPPGVVIHHWNEDTSDNRGQNLVICPDQSYHKLLHTRAAAIAACGNPTWRKCWLCRQYSAPEDLRIHRRVIEHPHCINQYQRTRAAIRKGKS